MAREFFERTNFRQESLALIQTCNSIINDYLAQGLRLTLRQLYYQLVSRALIPNQQKEYSKLSGLLSNARLAGLVDWDAIEDRVRVPRKHPEFENLEELVNAAIATYRLPRWSTQENYIELCVEKDALAGVLLPITEKYHITLMVNRGYSSQTAMYEAANRFREYPDKDKTLLYLGDHDPSGEDMVRDIQDRLDRFAVSVDVIKIALTMDQIHIHNPPPNPAKITDSRAEAYIAKHGKHSWEVDALPPQVLSKIVEDSINPFIDITKMKKIIKREDNEKKWLKDVVIKRGINI